MDETTVQQPPRPSRVEFEPPKMTPEQAEAYGVVMDHARPFWQDYIAHTERVNEQNRVAARPMFIIAGIAVSAVAGTALWAVATKTDSQLARDLLLPLLSFAGGLGIGRAASSANK